MPTAPSHRSQTVGSNDHISDVFPPSTWAPAKMRDQAVALENQSQEFLHCLRVRGPMFSDSSERAAKCSQLEDSAARSYMGWLLFGNPFVHDEPKADRGSWEAFRNSMKELAQQYRTVLEVPEGSKRIMLESYNRLLCSLTEDLVKRMADYSTSLEDYFDDECAAQRRAQLAVKDKEMYDQYQMTIQATPGDSSRNSSYPTVSQAIGSVFSSLTSAFSRLLGSGVRDENQEGPSEDRGL